MLGPLSSQADNCHLWFYSWTHKCDQADYEDCGQATVFAVCQYETETLLETVCVISHFSQSVSSHACRYC